MTSITKTLLLLSLSTVLVLSSTIHTKSKISHGDDDAEENSVTGKMYRYSQGLDLVKDNGQEFIVGLRFKNIKVPKGVTITNAYLQFTTEEINTEPTSLTIYGESSDKARRYTNRSRNISSRPKTVASVPWNNIPAWEINREQGEKQKSPDLSTIIQELINMPSWEKGKAMGFVLSGSGKRVAKSYNSNHTYAPVLYIEYSNTPAMEAPVNHTPMVNAGNDLSVPINQPITITGTATDSDGSIIAYEWREGATVLATTASFDYIPTIGTHALTLTVTDDDGATNSDEMIVTVNSNTPSGDTSQTQEVPLCQNNSAYVNTLYNLGMTINSHTAHGSVLSKGNNFVGAVVCGAFANATSSTDVLNSVKQTSFSNATNVIFTNDSDGSLKAQYELNGANRQAYDQLKSILEALGETDFSHYIDYGMMSTLQDIYIDIYVKYVDATTTYVIVTVTDKSENNINNLNSLVNKRIIAPSNNQNKATDTFTYSSDRLHADILFIMDDSGSMIEEQTAAAAAVVRTFGSAMSANGVDWKATVIGTEYGRNYLYRYINNPSENNITKLSSQLKLGTNGGNEYGLLRAYDYLINGDITVRNGSTLTVVYISDEVCHTSLSNLGVTDINNSYFVQNSIKVNSIIPLTGRYEGYGNDRDYDLAYKMANATGGEVANLHNYTTGYDAMMQKIADNAAGSASTIVLSHTPVIASIQVSINGVVLNSGWNYNSSHNSIVFDVNSNPHNGDTINITYNY